MPGALLLAEIAAALPTGNEFIEGLRKARFMQPVLPDQKVLVECADVGDGLVKFDCRVEDVTVARGRFIVSTSSGRD